MSQNQILFYEQNSIQCCLMNFFKTEKPFVSPEKRNGHGLKRSQFPINIHEPKTLAINRNSVPQFENKNDDRLTVNYKYRSSLKLKKSSTHKNLQQQSIFENKRRQTYPFNPTRASLDPENSQKLSNHNHISNRSTGQQSQLVNSIGKLSKQKQHISYYNEKIKVNNVNQKYLNIHNLNGKSTELKIKNFHGNFNQFQGINIKNYTSNRNTLTNNNQFNMNNDNLNFTFLDREKTSTFRELKNNKYLNLNRIINQNQQKQMFFSTKNGMGLFKKQSLKNKLQSSRLKQENTKKDQGNNIKLADLKQKQIHQFINPKNLIQSYILQGKQRNQKQNHNEYTNQQKQYQSIKTKGKAVESFVFVSKDLRKTKKTRKAQFFKAQQHFRSLQNITVNSEYQQQAEQSQIRQKIQQSAVLMNYFDPPAHIKQKMMFNSRSNYNITAFN